MFKKGMFFVLYILIFLYVITFCFGTSGESYYYSVKSYIKDNSEIYFDLYTPESYYYEHDVKETLKERNNVKMYYRGKPINNFHVTFEVDDVTFTYFVDKMDHIDINDDYDIIQYENYELYCLIDYSSVYCQVDDKVIYLHSPDDSEKIKSILVDIMKDSIKLNDK